ncbi:dimethyl sulfoxide reductase, subunit A1 [Salmonella enterica subsp. enterica serovar Daytona]|uniref:Dimethyl sulfoxide reductase, subunit A1 n=1 Tax=Salmonella enterica subsp. enterica serovar Daytona TaxID=1962639 RepID=A0A447JI15_SALET|nr:dimethyl sulfoxide reductase, subunit A1 [Salmonella enterica subsp. enterica serovar Daytona]
MPGEKQQTGVSRRTLVKSAALGSLALAAGGVSLPFGMRTAAAAVQQAMRNEEDKIVWGACSVNCGSRCALRLHVKDNEVWWVETDNTGDDVYGNHQVRACLRGRSIRRRINHPDRLNYPMKRVGRRGEGKFERISWQEALDTISASLKKTVETYGNEAVYIHYSSGIVGGKHNPLVACRLAGEAFDELLRRFVESIRLIQYRANFLRHALHLWLQRRQQHV